MTVATINPDGSISLWGAPNPDGHNGPEYPVIVTGQQIFDPRYYTQPYTLTQTADGVVQAYGSLVPQDLATVQTAKLADLNDDYDTAVQQPVSYISKGGVTQTYQGDDTAVSNLSKMLLAFQGAGATPPGFFWIASDNTQVPFTYADMQGLAQAIGVNALTAFGNLQAKKAAVLAASTSAAVVDITW
jgi:hypothetical protein